MGDFTKKISCRLISRKKILARKYLAKKKSYAEIKSVMEYNAGKYLTPLYFGKKNSITKGQKGRKILSQSKSLIPPPLLPQKSNGRPLSQSLILMIR